MALERTVQPGASVLDVGCGSGVLSVVAAKLGATRVVGIDIDNVAVDVAKNNVAANEVADRTSICRGDLASGVSGTFDVVVANILADIVIELMPELSRVLAPDGRFICSGFVAKFAHRVEQSLRAVGHVIVDRIQVGDWATLVSEAEL